MTDSKDVLRATPRRVVGPNQASSDGPLCDGLHDEGAPEHYLCSRCFPEFRGDLVAPHDDESAEAVRHESEEIE